MTRRTSFIVAAFAAVVLAAWVGAYAQNTLQAKPTAVAVVDVEQVLNQVKEKTALEAQFRAMGEKFQSEEKQRKAELADMQSALDALPEGKDYDKKQEELQKKVLELQVFVQFSQQKLAAERTLQIETLYRKTNQTVEAMAKEAGFDLVLYREAEIKTRGANLQQMMGQLANRKIIYASDEINITDEVITRMNNDFAAAN